MPYDYDSNFMLLSVKCSAVGIVQAMVHLVLDVGELGATLGILWACLRTYRPKALGWFKATLRPALGWLGEMALACAFFPLVDLVAARSQVQILSSLVKGCLTNETNG